MEAIVLSAPYYILKYFSSKKFKLLYIQWN
jgi:hypothetical protein